MARLGLLEGMTMANICSNAMAVYGERTQLEKLHAAIMSAWSVPHDRNVPDPKALLQAVGYTKEEADAADLSGFYSFDCDETITTGKYGVTYFKMWFETKWGPIIDVWDDILARFFPELKQVTTAEESGCEIFVNTDSSGYFFPERYCVDGSVGNHYTSEMEDPYVRTKEEALGVINAMCVAAGVKTFGTIDEALAFFDDDGNNPFPDKDFFLNVNEFSYSY